ncbi:MAG: DUF5060 domain-containing protein, partial [Planctomycetes bacterium]|nr:DUF5060 domain-containing protein [Planctomycetota bacterium]
ASEVASAPVRSKPRSASEVASPRDGTGVPDYKHKQTAKVSGFYDGNSTWRVRFAPGKVGEWAYEVEATRGESKASVAGKFQCVESKNPGFVRVDGHHHRGFTHDDGTPFYLMGGGAFSPWLSWVTGAHDWESYLAEHERAGMNCVRLFLYQEPHRGRARREVVNTIAEGFTDRYDLAIAQRLDEAMAEAQKRGVKVILTLFDHHPQKFNWERSAFNVLNGGFCTKPADLFTNLRTRDIQFRMVDYVVNRYGAFANLLAWEFWNEVDLVPGADLGNDKPAVKWHRDLAQHLAEADPYGHIRFTSFSSGVIDAEWFAEPWNEVISFHHYAAYGGGNERNVDEKLHQALGDLRELEKPIVVAELGHQKKKNDMSAAKGEFLRVAMWSTVFQGNYFILWDDADFRIMPETRQHVRHLTSFAAAHGLAALHPIVGPSPIAQGEGLRAWQLADEGTGRKHAVYVRSTRAGAAQVTGARLALRVRDPGTYRVRWFDPKTGETVQERERGT